MASSTRTRKNAQVAKAAVAAREEAENAEVETERRTATAEDKPVAKKERKVKPTEIPLDTETVAWVAANARPAVTKCLCGCGRETKGRFFPGDDAKLKARLEATIKADDGGDAQIPGTAAAAAADARRAQEIFGW